MMDVDYSPLSVLRKMLVSRRQDYASDACNRGARQVNRPGSCLCDLQLTPFDDWLTLLLEGSAAFLRAFAREGVLNVDELEPEVPLQVDAGRRFFDYAFG